MKSDFQNSSEDRLIDELLREQSNGPDEALLRQIESAVDAGASVAVKRPTRRYYGRLAIAAGIALVAAASIFFHLESRDSRNSIAMRQASDAEVAGKVKAASRSQELDQAIRDQEARVDEKRKVLATIEARPADGESTAVTPTLIGKLKYVKDESLTWVIRPSYGDNGKFPFNYLDNKGGVNKTGAADMIGPNELFFTKGVMMNRFKFLGSKVRRELSPKTNSQVEITYVRIEDQRPNKKGMVYELPAPLSEERINEHQKFDRTAIFSLEALGLNGKEFKVEENTAFSLPPGGEKKDYLLKSITPAGVVVEMVDGGQMVEISKGSMPAGEALAANPANSERPDISANAIKRGLDAQDYVELKREFEADQQKLRAMRDGSSLESGVKEGQLVGTGSGSGAGLGSSAPASVNDIVAQSGPSDWKSREREVPPFAHMEAAAGSGGLAFRGADASSEHTSGDRYGTFIDQPWKSPDRDPLSTFSIDVDTASYGSVRRMIREGREIPRDAVRIEECINAFKYNYAQPKGDGPFAVSATLAVCPWAPEHQLVRVAIKGREIETNKRPASNLVFLIDVSGSMQSPDKLPLLRQSMATMVEQLDERDRVAIVVYAGTEGVALPSTRLDAEGRASVLKSLEKLEAGGSTNGGAGIKRAYEIAMKEKIDGGVNRVILATDGDFNVGVTGQESLVELVKDRAKSGVYLTVAGFGTGNLNDAMMDAITRDGNGNYFYIDSEREGRKVFLQNLSGTLVTIAKDVKIQVEFNPAKVGGYRLIGYANRVLRNEDFHNDKIDAGDIGAGHTVTAFYELTPPGTALLTGVLKYQPALPKPAATTDEWLTVKLRHKHPDGVESSKIEFPLTGDALALDKTDADFQFATAAALFGMKLRGMEEVKAIAWEKVIELAKPGLGDDSSEDRAEFVGLVKKLAGTRERAVSAPAEVVPMER
jgi:Ca-activated chloride channel family protein